MTIKLQKSETFNYAETLKNRLEDILSIFNKASEKVLASHNEGNFLFNNALYITRELTKSNCLFALEVDGNYILDIQGNYNYELDEFSNLKMVAILPMHEDWIQGLSDHIPVEYTEDERKKFLSLQTKFMKELDDMGAYLITEIQDFNPEYYCIPASLVDFGFTGDTPFYKKDVDYLVKLLKVIYSYQFSMNKLFDGLNASKDVEYVFSSK